MRAVIHCNTSLFLCQECTGPDRHVPTIAPFIFLLSSHFTQDSALFWSAFLWLPALTLKLSSSPRENTWLSQHCCAFWFPALRTLRSGWGPIFSKGSLACLYSGPNPSKASALAEALMYLSLGSGFNSPKAAWKFSCLCLYTSQLPTYSLHRIVLHFSLFAQANISLLLPAPGHVLKY